MSTYLALSKVALGDFPMAPNPTPTANPSAKRYSINNLFVFNVNFHVKTLSFIDV